MTDNNPSSSNVKKAVKRKNSSTMKKIMINDINLYSSNWELTAKITVKSEVRTWEQSGTEKKSFSVNLLDGSGGEIRCTFFDQYCDQFYPSLQINGIYDIAYCSVNAANSQYNDFKSNYELKANNKTTFESNCDIDRKKFKIDFQFSSFSDVMKMKDKSTVDFIGIVWHVGDLDEVINQTSQKKFYKKDVVLIDEDNNCITVQVWKPEAELFTAANERQILALKRAKVSEYNKIKKLSVSPSTVLELNYDGDKKTKLESWLNDQPNDGSTNAA